MSVPAFLFLSFDNDDEIMFWMTIFSCDSPRSEGLSKPQRIHGQGRAEKKVMKHGDRGFIDPSTICLQWFLYCSLGVNGSNPTMAVAATAAGDQQLQQTANVSEKEKENETSITSNDNDNDIGNGSGKESPYLHEEIQCFEMLYNCELEVLEAVIASCAINIIGMPIEAGSFLVTRKPPLEVSACKLLCEKLFKASKTIQGLVDRDGKLSMPIPLEFRAPVGDYASKLASKIGVEVRTRLPNPSVRRWKYVDASVKEAMFQRLNCASHPTEWKNGRKTSLETIADDQITNKNRRHEEKDDDMEIQMGEKSDLRCGVAGVGTNVSPAIADELDRDERRRVDGEVYTPSFIKSLSGSEGNKVRIQIEVDLNRTQMVGGLVRSAQRLVGLVQLDNCKPQGPTDFTAHTKSPYLCPTRKEILKEKEIIVKRKQVQKKQIKGKFGVTKKFGASSLNLRKGAVFSKALGLDCEGKEDEVLSKLDDLEAQDKQRARQREEDAN
ncbi:hypothetical protein TEA_006946 [Camellia sinensis var. sinensis]|uniref:Uncharacterized protein n=1 Tax=Camellia sinensis var. sinensis TaxID=542762 RepID=A0A4S4DL02_CAMSN|nr:hypothetical protein TEA_006946 [Camellia sinensis var. sinensis]